MSQKTLDLVVPNVIMMDLGDKELLIAGGPKEDSRRRNGRGGGGLESCCNSLTGACSGLGECESGYLCCLNWLD